MPTDASRVYRGALIGAGGIARTAHLPGLRADPALARRLQVVAALDADPRIDPLDNIPLYRDPAALLAAGPLDFVDVCTPPASHLPLTLWALEHGLHVLCEKPVAVDRAQAATLVAAARTAGRVVVPCHQYRFNPVWQRIGQWVHDGVIGHWHLAELSVYRLAADAGVSREAAPWRTQRAEGAGGILLDHGTHLIYSVLDLAGGDPVAVRAWTGRLRHREYDVEDTAQLVLEFPPPGRLATVFLTWSATHRENRVRLIGDRGSIDWHGGVLTLETDGRRETHDYSVQLDKRSYAGWFSALFHTFADALDRGDDDAALDDIGRVAAVIEAAYESARTGSAVDVTPTIPR